MSNQQQEIQSLEAARDSRAHDGFLYHLFRGKTKWDEVFPLRQQTAEDKIKADMWLQDFENFVVSVIDPDKVDREGELPKEFFTGYVEHGGSGMKIPEEYGGLGLSQANYRRVAVKFGSFESGLCAFFSAHNSLGAVKVLLAYGTEKQKQEFLPRLAKGEISAFGLTERSAGASPFENIETFAISVKDSSGEVSGYRLFGEKMFNTNGIKDDGVALAKWEVVCARLVDHPRQLKTQKPRERTFGLFLIDTASEGFLPGPRFHFKGAKAIYNGGFRLRNCFVPAFNRISQKDKSDKELNGDKMALETLTVARLTLPALCAGGLKQLFRMARYWVNERVQLGGRIGEHQQTGKRLVDLACHAMLADALSEHYAVLADEDKDLRIESSAIKLILSRRLWDGAQDCFMMRGGRGFETTESQMKRGEVPMPLERIIRDVDINLHIEGTEPVMLLYEGRESGDDYSKLQKQLFGGGKMSFLKRWLNRGLGAIKGLWYLVRCGYRSIPLCIWPQIPLSALSWWRHLLFIKQETRRIARDALPIIGWYREGLASKYQLPMVDLVLRMHKLLEMSAMISTAIAWKDKPLATELADYFCWRTRDELRPMRFRAFRGSHVLIPKLAHRLMAGEASWLEDGIIPISLEKPNLPVTEKFPWSDWRYALDPLLAYSEFDSKDSRYNPNPAPASACKYESSRGPMRLSMRLDDFAQLSPLADTVEMEAIK